VNRESNAEFSDDFSVRVHKDFPILTQSVDGAFFFFAFMFLLCRILGTANGINDATEKNGAVHKVNSFSSYSLSIRTTTIYTEKIS
jgi:hypothetical protein